MRIAVDLRAGQKTGYFLDQRENRFRSPPIRPRPRARRTASRTRAGFSVSAALGGRSRGDHRAGLEHDRSADATRARRIDAVEARVCGGERRAAYSVREINRERRPGPR